MTEFERIKERLIGEIASYVQSMNDTDSVEELKQRWDLKQKKMLALLNSPNPTEDMLNDDTPFVKIDPKELIAIMQRDQLADDLKMK